MLEMFAETQNILHFKLERARERKEERNKETEGIRGNKRKAGSAGRLSIRSISGGAAHASELL